VSPCPTACAGSTFAISRTFKWYPHLSGPVRAAGSLEQVLAAPGGELFWFDGKHLFIKMTDPSEWGLWGCQHS